MRSHDLFPHHNYIPLKKPKYNIRDNMRKHTYNVYFTGEMKGFLASSILEATLHALSYSHKSIKPKDIIYIVDAETGETYNDIKWDVSANKIKNDRKG